MRLPTKIGNVLAAWVVFVSASLALAQPEVTATVDRNAMNPDDTLTFTVSISSSEEVAVSQPTLPDMHDFEVLNQWTSEEARGTLVNTPSGPRFQTRRSTRYNYMLAPRRQGTLTIGAVEVVADNKTYLTKPLSVRVAPGAGTQRPQEDQRPQRQRPGLPPGIPPGLLDDEEQDLFSQLLRRGAPPSAGSRNLPINPNEAFFIQADVDKNEAYVGEQVTVSFYLYTRGQIRDLDTLKYPALKGFWKEDIEIATHLNFSTEIVNGLPYKKALLASFALFPIKEGPITIDSYTAKCTVLPSLDSLGGFGVPKEYAFTKSSQPIKIQAKPLPTEGRPPDFTGAVGEYQVSARVEDRHPVEGQPFTFKLRFEGRGNAKMIEFPPFEPPQGLEIYDRQDDARFYRTGTSYKEFSVLMIPRREGSFTIPGVSVSVFDPQQKRYVKKSTEPVTVIVGKGQGLASGRQGLELEEGAESDGSSGGARKKTPREPRLETQWRANMRITAAQRGVGFGLLFAAIVATLLWRARVELGWGQRKKDLQRQLRARLRKVHARLEQGDWRGVGIEMTNTVYFVLGEVSGEGGAHTELEKLMLKAPPSVRRELAEPVAKQMQVFQILSFAPENVVGSLKEPEQLKKAVADMEKLMERAVSLGSSAEQSDGSEPDPKAS